MTGMEGGKDQQRGRKDRGRGSEEEKEAGTGREGE